MSTQSEPTPQSEPTTVDKLQGLPWSIASNTANTFFVQFTFFGSVFALFLAELGLSKGQMGFLFSLMPFFGLVALFLAPWAARFGYKRTFVTFFAARKVVTLFLLLTPVVLARFGSGTTLLYVSVVVGLFALFRSMAETARFPWIQEFVPAAVQGKYTANNNIFATLGGFLAVTIAGYVVGRSQGLTGYMILIGAGVAIGFVSVLLASKIPGGQPIRASAELHTTSDMQAALRDRDFLLYLVGLGCIILATVPVASFLPLFMQEEIGLSSGSVVWLQNATLLGSLLTSYLWGWAADRYGSKPVMLWGVVMRIFLPVLLMLMPRSGDLRMQAALAISVLRGISDIGWGVGSARLLFVNLVPRDKKSGYMALHFAWIGLIGGISQLFGGRLLDLTSNLSFDIAFLHVDAFAPLFALSVVLSIVSAFILRKLAVGEQMGIGEFTGIFLRGNPFLAMGSLILYQYAKDEQSAIKLTERLGQARSPLTVDELLDALKDPRYNVRQEAVYSVARMQPEPRLTAALVDILNGTELALSGNAAWALGRIGDPEAFDPLFDALQSPRMEIRARCARALGTLGDRRAIPRIVELLEMETDKGLQMAYAYALGHLRATDSTDLLLSLFESMQNEGARLELALGLARLIGDEGHFIRLNREIQDDLGTTAAQEMEAIRKQLEKNGMLSADASALFTACTDALAHNELRSAASLLVQLISEVADSTYNSTARIILRTCAWQLEGGDLSHHEALILVLHALRSGVRVG